MMNCFVAFRGQNGFNLNKMKFFENTESCECGIPPNQSITQECSVEIQTLYT